MQTTQKYKQFISDFIHQQIMLYGPNVTVSTANRVHGIEINNRGHIFAMQGEPLLVLESLIAEFEKLSPTVTRFLISKQLEQMPELKEDLSRTFDGYYLRCQILEDKKK